MWRHGRWEDKWTGAAAARTVRQPPRGKRRIPLWPCDLMCAPKEWKTTQTNACMHMFLSALVTKAKGWKQPKCPQTHGRMNTWVHICTMESCAAMNRHEAQTPAAPSSKTSCHVRSHTKIMYGATQTSCYIRGVRHQHHVYKRSHTNIMYVKEAAQTSCM